MSYMRHPIYVWASSRCEDSCPIICHEPTHEDFHLWVRADNDDDRVGVLESPELYEMATGISVRGDLFDMLVLCRFAEMVLEGRVVGAVAALQRLDAPVRRNTGSYVILQALGEDDPAAEFKRLLDNATTTDETHHG